ncbi:hypothetical protein Cabys_951 [Caldithrix abyssi DSM 13497]|uniref:Uncharacterized protein n=1 Tax=Caldithrix abyssi DSM 13497 TaxID=880073 RepID=A0A1J1C558_CALAY|nr:hypothetical protein Cabys_951 [Caldithrix abyssi DSM 13497]
MTQLNQLLSKGYRIFYLLNLNLLLFWNGFSFLNKKRKSDIKEEKQI